VNDARTFETLCRQVTGAWQRGWMPTDLVRYIARYLDGHGVSMLVDLIAAEARAYPAATIDTRWARQLADTDGTCWWASDHAYFTAWAEREGVASQTVDRVREELRLLLTGLPKLPRLCPLPGSPATARPATGATGQAGGSAGEPSDTGTQRRLDKVRALLAKAESTGYPEEAEAYTAKAQELMARYSIDQAYLEASSGIAIDAPAGRRVGIDNPYEGAKALLLNQVAGANRCSAVWSRELGFVTVLGFDADLDAVELLYTSLRVQATTAMMRAGFRREARTKSFRRAFLTAYAGRIGQRLTEAADAAGRAVAEAEGINLLPVLAARDDRVREAMTEMFPQVHTREIKITNRAGWASGIAAADLANLHVRRPVAH
jgi:hypothetical protein